MYYSHHTRLRTVGALPLLLALVLPACAEQPDTEQLREGELMFGLTDEDVEAFHDLYVPDDDLELTRARLTAPFDCALFDDFCAQVGLDAAVDITQRQVELGLDGVPLEQMNEATHAWIVEAMDSDESDEPDESQFRSSSPWAIRTKGNYRLKVRNGITTPLSGDREAWTESRFQHWDWPAWWAADADELCVNAGTNTQVQTFGPPGDPTTIESKNPAEKCVPNENKVKRTTTHSRNTGFDNGTLWLSYSITADGCGSGDNNGSHFGICPSHHVALF